METEKLDGLTPEERLSKIREILATRGADAKGCLDDAKEAGETIRSDMRDRLKEQLIYYTIASVRTADSLLSTVLSDLERLTEEE